MEPSELDETGISINVFVRIVKKSVQNLRIRSPKSYIKLSNLVYFAQLNQFLIVRVKTN